MIAGGIALVNIGLPLVAEAAESAGTPVVQLDWRPPAGGDPALARLMSLLDDETSRAANERALAAVHAVRPRLTGVAPARDVVPGLGGSEPVLLHAGPPLGWERMCGPMRGALTGAVLLEGWADTPETARKLFDSGGVSLEPCHDHCAVGPMAGVVSPSMPVLVVQDSGRSAFATLNEGLGKVLRFGAYDDEVLRRLAWLRDVIGPAINAALTRHGAIDLSRMTGQALTMGDEGHNRNVAATSLLARALAADLCQVPDGSQVLAFLADNDHFYLNASMAAAKLSMDAAADVPGSTLVTAMSRNGVEFGLRVAGTGSEWFTTAVGPADGLFFPGYGHEDANPDMGDSSITETLGLGGFAMAAAPAITRFVGGSPADALAISRAMARITLGRHPAFQLPALDFAGTPGGIDVLKVVETGELPVINTGIAHREAGVGQIGAGIVRAPAEVFTKALRALASGRGLA